MAVPTVFLFSVHNTVEKKVSGSVRINLKNVSYGRII